MRHLALCLSLLFLCVGSVGSAEAYPARYQRALSDRGPSRARVQRLRNRRTRLRYRAKLRSFSKLRHRRAKQQPVNAKQPRAEKLQQRFRFSVGVLRRMVKLARDPAHNNLMTKTSKREAVVGIMLEMQGKLAGPIRREKTGASEFVDAKGTHWDVKAFNSHWPQKAGGFKLERALRKLGKQFAGGEKVILDTANLERDHVKQLRRGIEQRGWSDNVLWF